VSDYLWDGRGEPDPEVERLERVLLPLRHQPKPLELSEVEPRRALRPFGGVLVTLAAAAGFVVAVAGPLLFARPGWEVERLAGTPRVGERVVADKGRLSAGDWLTTDAGSRARLKIGDIGEVVLEPGSRLGLVDPGRRQHRLTLPKGAMHARIGAPPGKFYVDTPAATAVDLGCEYRLEVDESGAGALSVLLGYVGFEWHGRESYVPERARCLTRPELGPGTPFYADASDAFRRALERFDFDSAGPERLGALGLVLSEARPRDALSLWHLLLRAPEAQRGLVFDRLAELLPPPQGVTREGVLRGDRAMLDSWWDLLEIGSMKFWRRWTQKTAPALLPPAR
jgi:hypothetical protein